MEAERLTRKQLERRPDDGSARLLLGQILLQLRQNAEAIAEIRRVVREQPKNVDALLSLSAALTQQGGFRIPAEAEATARRAIQLAPRNANAHVQLAEVMAAKRDFKVARAEIEEACRLDPRSPNAHLMRADHPDERQRPGGRGSGDRFRDSLWPDDAWPRRAGAGRRHQGERAGRGAPL